MKFCLVERKSGQGIIVDPNIFASCLTNDTIDCLRASFHDLELQIVDDKGAVTYRELVVMLTRMGGKE